MKIIISIVSKSYKHGNFCYLTYLLVYFKYVLYLGTYMYYKQSK